MTKVEETVIQKIDALIRATKEQMKYTKNRKNTGEKTVSKKTFKTLLHSYLQNELTITSYPARGVGFNYLLKLDPVKTLKLFQNTTKEIIFAKEYILKKKGTIRFNATRSGTEENNFFQFQIYHLGKWAWLIATMRYDDNRNDLKLYFTGKNCFQYYRNYVRTIDQYEREHSRIFTWNDDECRWCIKRMRNKEGDRKLIYDEDLINSTINELNAFMNVSKQLYKNYKVAKATGLLLYGPPGTGKTTLVRFIARQLQLPVRYATPNSIDNLSNRTNPDPKIIVFEDIDVICDSRDGDEAARQRFNSMLQYLDGVNTPPCTIFIATTNHPEKLDDALTRNGRFGRRIELTDFDIERARQYCDLNGLPQSILENETFPISPAKLDEKLINHMYSKMINKEI